MAYKVMKAYASSTFSAVIPKVSDTVQRTRYCDMYLMKHLLRLQAKHSQACSPDNDE